MFPGQKTHCCNDDRMSRISVLVLVLLAWIGEHVDDVVGMVACSHFQQTANCDPGGKFEQRKSCKEEIPDGVSGFCHCSSNIPDITYTCQHTPIRCTDACFIALDKAKHVQSSNQPYNNCHWHQTGGCDPNGKRENKFDKVQKQKQTVIVMPVVVASCGCLRDVRSFVRLR